MKKCFKCCKHIKWYTPYLDYQNGYDYLCFKCWVKEKLFYV